LPGFTLKKGVATACAGNWLVFAGSNGGRCVYRVVGDAPISMRAILVVVVILAAVFFLPGLRSWGLRVRLARGIWQDCYSRLAHRARLRASRRTRTRRPFFVIVTLEVQSRGALPFPPSLWHWDGLVLTPRGVYELRMNLGGESTECKQQAPSL